jgi:hypothetical protein
VPTLPIIRAKIAKREILLPDTTVTREWPVNVVPGDEALFHHERARRFPHVRMRTVRAAKVIPGFGPCSWYGAIREGHFRSRDWRTKVRSAKAGGRRIVIDRNTMSYSG